MTSEWTGTAEIIKLTFKGISQVLRNHYDWMKELDHSFQEKLYERETFQKLLSRKVNVDDMKQTISEMAQNIESRAGFDDVKRLVDDKANKQELHYLLQNKLSYEEFKQYMD